MRFSSVELGVSPYMTHPLDPRFPEPVRELWATLSADVVWLHGRWSIYRQLFGTNQDRIDLLNEAAGTTVTWIFQQLLLHDVQLTLSKIGEPAGKGDRKNLTLRRLQQTLRNAGDSAIADAMEIPLGRFEVASQKLVHRRNKWIAHSDLETRLSSRVSPLAGPSRQEIEDSLSPLREAMNCVELKFTGSRTVYEHFVMNQDGEHLLSSLVRAKRYSELVKEGGIPRDDICRRFPSGV